MKIIVKCWTPEWYDDVTHAVIEFDVALADNLLAKLALAARMEKLLGDRFMGLEYNSPDPTFINFGDPTDIGLEDDDSLDEGYEFIPAKFQDYEFDETAIRPVIQCVMAGCGGNGRVYWYGFDKHGNAGCRAETYSLSEQDIRDIREELLCPSTP